MPLFQGAMTGFNAFTQSVAAAAYVKSVQYVDITLGSGVTSNTATITSVDATRSFVVLDGTTTTITAQNGATTQARIELTNATTVTAVRNTGTSSVTVRGMIVECFSAFVNSVQNGTISISASTSGTATVTAVTTANAVAIYLGETTTSTSTIANWATRLTLTNSTTITATVNTSSTCTVGYSLIDFVSGTVNSVQQVSTTSTSAATTMTTTISSVTTGNCLLFYGGQTNANANYANLHSADLTNATTVTWTRNGTSTNSRTSNVTVVDFAAAVVKSTAQRATTAVNNSTSQNVTITSVDTNKAVLSSLFFNSNSSQPNTFSSTVKLTAATTLNIQRNTGGALTVNVSWDSLEFN